MTDVMEQVREKLTMLSDKCYTQEGSACPIHPVFQPQKFINLILALPEILIKDLDQSLPTDRGVNINFKAKPELSMPAQKEIAETAIIAYKQAEQDMLKENWVKAKEKSNE